MARPPRCCAGDPTVGAFAPLASDAAAEVVSRGTEEVDKVGAAAATAGLYDEEKKEEENGSTPLFIIGEPPPEDDGLEGATADSSERIEATSSSDPAAESEDDGGTSFSDLTRCASALNILKTVDSFNDVGEFGRCPKISVSDWLSSSLAHIGESLEPGTTPSERSVDILVFFL